jgi:acyl transferase domain-containing protein
MKNPDHPERATGLEIAIVGMAGRFPQAKNLEEFWHNLRSGRECISFFTDEELLAANPDLDRELLANPRFVKAGGVLADADRFDADFFAYSPREAEVLDPQQRIFLECAWEALEDAGHDPRRYSGLTGVYAGSSLNTYFFNILTHPELLRSLGATQLAIGNDKDFLATRVSYKLDLEGPSLTVQTACSTSLVAVHLACQGLLAGECDMALAGGVSATFPQQSGYTYRENGILSPDGHCRAFDARAQGTVGGKGVGVVVLKRLADALADGDRVRAVIKGSAINNDGAGKVGYTAPRIEGQAKVIQAAQQIAGVEPQTVSYVEAHGTATELGDPIEVAALNAVFRAATDRRHFCALGSVKTNIGHLDAAAGIASLLKAVLALEHGEIPPSLHFEAPNPEVDLAESPFFVADRLLPWPTDGAPRRAGVSAFGLGGTNAHLVLEEAPPLLEPPEPAAPARPWHLLLLSARTAPALERATANLAAHLERRGDLPFADVAYTTQVGRRAFAHRRALVASGREDAAAALAGRDPRRLLGAVCPDAGARPVAFLLSGLGDHYAGMGSGLYRAEPVFRDEVDRCAELLRPHLGLDLRQALLPPDSAGEEGDRLDLRQMVRPGVEPAAGPLARTALAQPALFVIEMALARLWASWGVRPTALLGYSLGEYAAACLAGVLSLADALVLVSGRARLIDALPAGAMLAVPLAESEVAPLLAGDLALAAVNAPALAVVAGPPAAVAALAGRLAGDGIACRPLQTSHAFHSPLMAPIVPAFRELVRSVALHPPRIPLLSNVTGGWMSAEEATDPEYWVRHLAGAVRFADGVGELWREPGRILLEVGPGQSLGSLALQHPAAPAERLVLPSLRHAYDRQGDPAHLLRTLAQLWLAGVEVDWEAFHAGEARRRVPLPTYPFERQRFWIDARPRAATAAAAAPADRAAAPAKLPDLAGWFHVPSWRHAPAPRQAAAPDTRWWVFADRLGVGEALAARLEREGCEVARIAAREGEPFAALGERRWALDPGRPEDYDALLDAAGAPPDRIVHLWNVTEQERPPAAAPPFAAAEARAFYGPLALVQALARRGVERPLEIAWVANGLHAVERGDALHPEKALLAGPLLVAPQEVQRVSCRAIDVDLRDAMGGWIEGLWQELGAPAAGPVVARRGGRRWVREFVPLSLGPAPEPGTGFRPGGVYLITGGLGGIGLGIAAHLARTVRAKLVLVGRTGLPERAEWERLAAAGDETARRIDAVRDLEAAGSEVLALAADVADERRLSEVVALARARFGAIHGVLHAAGVPAGGLAQLKTPEAAAAVLRPKVAGTVALAAALAAEPLDFLVLFSSLSAVLGGIGHVDYCAANAFLDAFAAWHRAARGVPTVAIDWCEWQWDAWSEAGLAAFDADVRARLRRDREATGLTFVEGAEALGRALASGEAQVLVSTRDLVARIESERSVGEILERLAAARGTAATHPRPLLAVEYVAPRNPIEEKIAGIWQDLLGIERVGVHDDFFQLGGHSLLGTQVTSRLRELYGVTLLLRTLFESPTVAALAAAVAVKQAESAPPAATAIPRARRRGAPAVRQEDLDRLSEPELDALLAEMMAGSGESA